jgi:hypothetical protein
MQNFSTTLGNTVKTASRLGLAIVLALMLGSAVFSADAVLDWNKIAVDTVAPGQSPYAQARYAAIVQLAVFEAVNAVTGHYRPYLGTIVAPSGASADAAAVQAAYDVLVNYFPNSQTSLQPQLAASLGLIPAGQSKQDGIATGHAAAAAMIALRANDGSTIPKFYTPGPVAPGAWQATPSCPIMNGIAVGTFLHWQNVTPFGISNVEVYLLDPPPALTSNRYAKAYNEVLAVGNVSSSERPQDRADVVHFFQITSPTQALNQAARQVAVEKAGTLSENARALALVNMAASDSLVASFFNKYHYNFWRPETAIRAGDTDDNPKTEPDTSFVPFIPTPCFPSYPSNHASGTNGGTEVLRHLYGDGRHSITLVNPALPTVVLQYTRFEQIDDDVDDARVYGGIHFRTDQDAGARLGRAIGRAVYKHNLRRIHDDDHDDDHDDK